MSAPEPPDLRRTAEEAERLLNALENNAPPAQPDQAPPWEPPQEQDATSPSGARPRRQGPSSARLLTAAAVAGIVGIVVVAPWLHNLREGSLPYHSSCGSRSSPSGDWWPVLGPADPELLTAVRERYCGDAYINANGFLQVASFSSREEAETFARRLGREIGVAFRTGGSQLR